MTNREEIMYHVLGEISSTDAPIVFKGALITKLILAENGYKTFERATKDIDANWVDTPPSMDELVNAINLSLGKFQRQYTAIAKREYGDKQSAGISVIDRDTAKQFFSMDIKIKPVIGSRVYHYGEVSIKGVLVDEILSDKIAAISDDKIFQKAKHMIDIYALSQCSPVETANIFAVCEKTGRKIKSFDAFYAHKPEVQHAYSRLKRIENKPDFDMVYDYLAKFNHAFSEKDGKNRVWDSNSLSWSDK